MFIYNHILAYFVKKITHPCPNESELGWGSGQREDDVLDQPLDGAAVVDYAHQEAADHESHPGQGVGRQHVHHDGEEDGPGYQHSHFQREGDQEAKKRMNEIAHGVSRARGTGQYIT